MAKMTVPVVLDNGATPFPSLEVGLPDQDLFRCIVAHQGIYGQVIDTPANGDTPATYRDMTPGETARVMFEGWIKGALANTIRWEHEQAAKAAAAGIPAAAAPTFTAVSEDSV